MLAGLLLAKGRPLGMELRITHCRPRLLPPHVNGRNKDRTRWLQILLQAVWLASRRLYILQVRPPRIGRLIVIPSNSELIYRHRSRPLAVVRKRSGPSGSWGDAGARVARAARGRLQANSGTAAHYFGHTALKDQSAKST